MMLSSSFSSSSSSSANVRVEKATSDLLIGPDWTMNIDICDSINSNHWQAKDVVKAVKKRLQHKSPKVQLLALTLLETMVKNCGDYMHFQIAEKNILQEMIKIVRKKADMHVRDKILVLLDSWQEAFGGPGGKHPQYYWAFDELRRSGVEFPQRSFFTAPIFTPPVTHPTLRQAQAGYGMRINSSTRLDEAMAAELENLSLASINSMQNVLNLLADMLQAVNPSDQAAVKNEIIVDLVAQCRANQRKLMQMLTTTGDEELLAQGLELNDSLQSVLAKHDAMASGSPLPTQVTNFSPRSNDVHDSGLKPTEVRETSPSPNANSSAQVVAMTWSQMEDEEEDDFAQLARRHSKSQSNASQSTSTGTSEGNSVTSSAPAALTPVPSNALALPDPPAPIKTTRDQDMIDLLSLTLSTTTTSTPHTPQTPTTFTHKIFTFPSQAYDNQGQLPFNSYVAPWAQLQSQPQPQLQSQHHPQPQPQPQPQHQPQPQPHFPIEPQPKVQTPPQYGYPPPPWATTPGYFNSQTTPYPYSTSQANTTPSYMVAQGAKPLQHMYSFPARGSNGSAMNGEVKVVSTAPAAVGEKPFVPSYRLFEDLNVLGNGDGRFKMTSGTSPSFSGTSSQSMVGGRK